MEIRYSLTSGNAVEVFYEGSDIPSLRQPTWPNGDAWTDAAEASAWAELYLASITDETAPFAPNARGEAGAPKPTDEEIAAIQAEMEALRNPVAPE